MCTVTFVFLQSTKSNYCKSNERKTQHTVPMEYIRTVSSTNNGFKDLLCCFPLVNCSSSKVTNHSPVHVWPLSHASKAPQREKYCSKAVQLYFISIIIDWAGIYRKKILHWLPLFSYYYIATEHFGRMSPYTPLWLMTPICSAVLVGPSAFHPVEDGHHNECVQMMAF